MVQQNLVAFILGQLRQGKQLSEINEFLIRAGYDKQEVESSVQYMINTQTNPKLAEEQRIQQLSQYIQKQMTAGYPQQAISNFLISKGYPYYEVNSAMQQAMMPVKAPKLEHKVFILAMAAMIIMIGVVLSLYMKAQIKLDGVPERLLDVETEQLTTIVQQGGELNFEMKLINFGHEQRFDILLKHQVIDRETQAVVLEKQETVALSTTLERVVRFDIPDTLKPGSYVLRTDATYEDFTATSGFIFDVLDAGLAKERIEEIKKELPEPNVTEEEIPELAPEEAPEEPPAEEVPEEVPEEVVVPEEKPKEEAIKVPELDEEKPFYQGMTKQEAFERVKATSVRDPGRAVAMCQSYKYYRTTDDCLTMLAEFKKDQMFCDLIEIDVNKDYCYIELAQATDNYDYCKNITNKRAVQSCNLLETVKKIQTTNPEEMDNKELFSILTKAKQGL